MSRERCLLFPAGGAEQGRAPSSSLSRAAPSQYCTTPVAIAIPLNTASFLIHPPPGGTELLKAP